MKTRQFLWMMAAILSCGAMVFSSCSSDDHDSVSDNLSEKILGKWIVADRDGQPELTNDKEVITFVSPTKAYASRSRGRMNDESTPPPPQDMPEGEPGEMPGDMPEGMPGAAGWDNYEACDVTIEGNTVTLTTERGNGVKMTTKYIIKSISASEFVCEVVHEVPDGQPGMPPEGEQDVDRQTNGEQSMRYKKVTNDYKQDIVGTWEGRCTSEGSVFDDGQVHRWQYKSDGTYVYYVKDGDNWVPAAGNTLNEYFVDGTLLCTRWVDDGQDNREWWDIAISDNKMNWTALRQNADKTTFTATFEMTKVE